MSTAQTSDLGKLAVATSTSPALSVDPQEQLNVFNFRLAGETQKIEVRSLMVTNIGSTAVADLKNFKLYDGATQVGSTVENMNSDKTVTFDLSGNPLVIDKGITKNMYVKADIVGGTNRTFKFTIQNMTDIRAYDTQYGIYIKPNQSDSWTVLEMSNTSTISTGKLTLSRASDSASDNVALGGTNVSIAKFDVKATGEDVKITAMTVRVYGTVNTNDLYQGRIYFNGSQVGSTTNLETNDTDTSATNTSFTFGNTLIVPADGSTYTLEIRSDIKKGAATAYSGSETLTAKIQSTTAQGRSSLATVTVGTALGYQLTITAGTLSGAKNQSVANWSATNPTGVPGATGTLVGSFTVKAGASEGADITGIALQHTTTTTTTTSRLQNLQVYKGTKETGTQIGTPRASVDENTDYTFYPSPYVSLSASEDFVLNIYADISSNASAGSQGYIKLGIINGTGKVTSNSVSSSGTVDGQTIYVCSSGLLTITLHADSPDSAQLMADQQDVDFAKFNFAAGAGENISVTQLVVTATLAASAATSTIKNIELWDGTTQIGSTMSGLAADGTATFNISASPWNVPAGTTKVLDVRADVNDKVYIESAGTVTLGLATTTSVTAKGVTSGTATNGPDAPVDGYAMYTYWTVAQINTPTGWTDQDSRTVIPSATQEVGRFTVTNTGDYDLTLATTTFTFAYTQGSGAATTSANTTLRVRRTGYTTDFLDTDTISIGTTISGATSTVNVNQTIPSGTSRTYSVYWNTSDMSTGPNPSRLQLSFNAVGDLIWNDGSSAVLTLTNFLPLNFVVNQY